MNHYELHAYYFHQLAELDVPILQYPKLDIEIGMIFLSLLRRLLIILYLLKRNFSQKRS